MILRLLLLCMLFTIMMPAGAAERFVMKFELTQDEKIVYKGRMIVSEKTRNWSNGIKQSYLQLRCKPLNSGRLQRMYSNIDSFSGLRITHHIVGSNVELTVARNIVQPRLDEIRAVARKNECKEMLPIITTTSESYKFPTKDSAFESRPFGEKMMFSVKLERLSKNIIGQ